MADSKRSGTDEPVTLDVKFDPQAYVKREVINTRATIVLVIFGFVLGQVGVLVQKLVSRDSALGALVVFIIGLLAVKGVLETTGVTVADWEKKTWAGNLAILFFTFLAAWILFQNPPFWS